MLAGMCHCQGLDQGRGLAGLPGRPGVIFQPRNLPELFLAAESVLQALSRRAGDEQGPGRAGPGSCGSVQIHPWSLSPRGKSL